ncbi:MFS transporter [Emergencia sp. 1XD21-10]|uniref:MFS transporter n=1 Tax=Emergencia sp. 1XD21-10 TaxID=2304569 RepID=UPI00137A867C|nr:glycoside-pentoside-hexuronide (GPH):cation symporter [Emergencia sp. 1XD21-10]NCE97745.1 MFS transporter [Emergencia sp. 1XD21-10]
MKDRNKLPISTKSCFAIADFGKNCLIIFNTYFLLYFYTDIIQIDPGVAAIIMGIARIWDAINDPMMGVMVDRTKSKEGKCRFWLKYFSVPAGVCLFLSYFVPELSGSSKIIWVAVTYIFQGMATTITSVPLNTLLARLTDNREERVSLGQYKAVGTLAANLIIPAISLPMVTKLGGMDLEKGFALVAAIYAVAYALCHLVAYFGTKGYERTYEEEIELEPEKKDDVTIGQMLSALIHNKYCLIVSLSYIGYLLYASVMGSTLVYYLQYNIQNTGLMSAYSMIGTVTAVLPILFMRWLSSKIGNAKTCFFGCILAIANYALRFITRDAFTPLLFFCWGVEGIGLGLFGNMIFQCILDSMIYGKWKTGVDNQASIMSVFTFAQKFGQAIGGVVAAALLTLVPYVAGAEMQENSVLQLFFAENITIPAIAFVVIGLLFLYIAKIEKQIPQMQKEIEEREAAAEAR